MLSFHSPTRAAGRLLCYVVLTLALLPVQFVAVVLRLPIRDRLPRWYHRHCRQLLGFRIEVRGAPSRVRPTLYVANHVSYFDITILGALLRASFVAKSEIASWPVFGWLAKLQRSVFVERVSSRAANHRDDMMKRLEKGDSLILFPEGTSGDGRVVLPFKSALFSVAERRPHGKPLLVQPVSVTYAKLDGLPMGRYMRPFFAWYGDMDLMGHMWHAIGLGTVTVVVEFHEPVTLEQFGSRKAMAQHCHQKVADGVSNALAGRSAVLPETSDEDEQEAA